MPHKSTSSMQKASLVRNTLPTLCRLLTWSNTTAMGCFSVWRNSPSVSLPISVTFNFLMLFCFVCVAAKLTNNVNNCVNNYLFINIGDVKKSSFFSFSTIMKCYKNTFNLKNWTYQGFFLRKCINFACC